MPFCARCGKEVGEGVRFCPECGNRLIKTQGEQTATSALHKEVSGGEQGKCMNWFERHLNWTFVIGYGTMGIILGIIERSAFRMDPREKYMSALMEGMGLKPSSHVDAGEAALAIVGVIFFVGVMLLISAWILKKKGKSLWWSFLFVLFSPVWFGNEKGMGERGGKVVLREGAEPLLERLTRQLEPRYCENCGCQLKPRWLQKKGFAKNTGYPKYDVIIACPHATVYETSILSKSVATYEGLLNKHTVDRISLIAYPADKNV